MPQFYLPFGQVKDNYLSLRGAYRGPRGILCTRGEKAHTSKRVSIAASDNAISKAKCATQLRLKAEI